MTYRNHRAKLWGCVGVMGLFAGLILFLFMGINPHPYYASLPRPFSSESWKGAAKSHWDDDRRCGMVADLQFRIGLKGKSRWQITALLGPPEDERVEPGYSHWHLCPSFMDVWILEIRWDGDRVADAFVRDT